MKINRELLKGSTDLLILTILDFKPMYGYEMIKELKTRTQNVFEFKEGTLYPILHRLEENKYICSYWDEVDGKKRKYYYITEKGKKQLVLKKEEWKTFTLSINGLIGGALFEH